MQGFPVRRALQLHRAVPAPCTHRRSLYAANCSASAGSAHHSGKPYPHPGDHAQPPQPCRGLLLCAHPQNRFWPVIAALYGEEDPKTSEGRAELLLSHGLALWDVLASCTITGAADSTIRDPIPNDIPGLLRQYPGITRIAATGSTAAQLYRRLVEPQAGLPAIGLPSPSAANARASFPQLVAAYRAALL